MKNLSNRRRYFGWNLISGPCWLILVLISRPAETFADDIGNMDVHTPGCALGVNENGESVFRDAFGFADLEHGVPIETSSIMEAGSVSKQFITRS